VLRLVRRRDCGAVVHHHLVDVHLHDIDVDDDHGSADDHHDAAPA
jgi:hypothetical protein